MSKKIQRLFCVCEDDGIEHPALFQVCTSLGGSGVGLNKFFQQCGVCESFDELMGVLEKEWKDFDGFDIDGWCVTQECETSIKILWDDGTITEDRYEAFVEHYKEEYPWMVVK